MEQPARKSAGGAQVLLSIQALRGLAVMAVVVIHIQLYYASKLQRPDFLPQFNIGAASVDVFFVISGFIMVYATERLFGQAGAMPVYFLRRIARIVPMYWIATTIMVAYLITHYGSIAASAGGAGISYVICSYLFIPYGRPGGNGIPIHGIGWTLIYEVFFYTAFGLLVMWPRRAAVVATTAFLALIVLIGQLLPWLPNPIGFWTHPIIIEFAFGMAIALAYRNGVRLPQPLVYTLVAAGVAVLFWSWRQEHFFDIDSGARVFVWGLPAVAIVGGFALAEKPVPRNLFWRTFGFLGDASYSLYLFHTLGLGAPAILFGRYINFALLPWVHLGFILAATIVPGLLIYLFVEKPITEYLQRKIEGERRAAPAAMPIAATPPP